MVYDLINKNYLNIKMERVPNILELPLFFTNEKNLYLNQFISYIIYANGTLETSQKL